jgi:hypothetical protein
VNAANDSLRVNGVSRDASDARTLVIYFNERPSDDDMRRIHDLLREGSPATAPGRVPLRMLTDEEVQAAWRTAIEDDDAGYPALLQRKFCEVNGLPLSAADGEVEGAKG